MAERSNKIDPENSHLDLSAWRLFVTSARDIQWHGGDKNHVVEDEEWNVDEEIGSAVVYYFLRKVGWKGM